MPTIKDVAKLAGVSHGTVSNVLNGSNNVSLDKIKRVEDAMKTLNYKPNAIARNLKSTCTSQIDVILPNISDPANACIYENIQRLAMDSGYTASLYVTEEIPKKETDLLNKALTYNHDGVILVTCQPQNKRLFHHLIDQGLHMVFLLRQVTGLERYFINMNIQSLVEYEIEYQLQNNSKNCAIITGPKEYTFEESCIYGYFNAHYKLGRNINQQLIEVTNANKESAFQVSVNLLQSDIFPDAIIISNALIAEGSRKAIELIFPEQSNRPHLTVLTSYTWAHANSVNESHLYLPFDKLATAAFYFLKNQLDNGEKNAQPVILNDFDIMTDHFSVSGSSAKKFPIRVLLNNSPSATATASLLNAFRQESGIDVEIQTANYADILTKIKSTSLNEQYDVFSVDLPWIQELIDNDFICPLDEFIESPSYLQHTFSNRIFNEFSLRNNQIVALPYSYTIQLLAYRRDLFSKLKNQRLYYEWYKEELEVPTTWEKFNKVARFFTRKFNPESETQYGTTLGGKFSSGSVCEYLPRFWGFGGELFKDLQPTLTSKAAIQALENYSESFLYASPNSKEHWWDEQVQEFCNKDAAMMILFTEHISPVEDRRYSKVFGNVGYSFIPNRISLLGGWSLAMNQNSSHKKEAFEFINWMCSNKISVPSSILGRLIPTRSTFENMEIASIKPWLQTSYKAFSNTKKREIPNKIINAHISEQQFEDILGYAVYHTINGTRPAKEALEDAQKRLNRLLSS